MGEMAGTNLMKKLTSLLAAVLLLLLAISTAFAGQPADYNKPTVAAGTLVYLSNPRRASDDPGSPAARLAAKSRYIGLKLRTLLDFAAAYDTDGRLQCKSQLWRETGELDFCNILFGITRSWRIDTIWLITN